MLTASFIDIILKWSTIKQKTCKDTDLACFINYKLRSFLNINSMWNLNSEQHFRSNLFQSEIVRPFKIKSNLSVKTKFSLFLEILELPIFEIAIVFMYCNSYQNFFVWRSGPQFRSFERAETILCRWRQLSRLTHLHRYTKYSLWLWGLVPYITTLNFQHLILNVHHKQFFMLLTKMYRFDI